MKPQVTHILKRLKNHDRFCKVFTHEHYCSCGRDEAANELIALIEKQPQPYTEPTLEQIQRRLATQEPKP